MLRLWFWWLKWTRENRDLSIFYFLGGKKRMNGGLKGSKGLKPCKATTYFWHLWVTEILVHDHALDEFSVLQPPAHFAFYFDELEVDVSALHVGHGEDGVHGNLRHLPVTAVHPDQNTTADRPHSFKDHRDQSRTRDGVTQDISWNS